MLTGYLRHLASRAANTPIILITRPKGMEQSDYVFSLINEPVSEKRWTLTPLKSREPEAAAKATLEQFRNNWVFENPNSYFTREALENAVAKAKEESPLIYIPGFDPKLDEMVELHGLEAVINSARNGGFARAKPTASTEECVKEATENQHRAMQEMHVKEDIPVPPTPHEDTVITVNVEKGAGEAETMCILHHIGLLGYNNITVNEVDEDGNVRRACGSLSISDVEASGGEPKSCGCGTCSICEIGKALNSEFTDIPKEQIPDEFPAASANETPSDGAIYAAASKDAGDIFQQVFGDIFGFGKQATPELMTKPGTPVLITDAATLYTRLPRGVAEPELAGNWDMADYHVQPSKHLGFLAGRYVISRYWEKYGFVTLVSQDQKHVVKVKLENLKGVWVG